MAVQKIDSLTALRFFAAAAILVFHVRGHFGLPINLFAPFDLSQGVSFFFVLSGFILAYVYPDLGQGEKGATAKFWLARIARIWPMHIFALLLFFLLADDYGFTGPGQLLANVCLVQSWLPYSRWAFSFNDVSWSISTELFFYLCFPFLIRDFSKTWSIKLSLCFAVVAALISYVNWQHVPEVSVDGLSTLWLLYACPLVRLFEFVLGMTAAHLYRKYLLEREAAKGLALGLELAALAFVLLMTLNSVSICDWLCRQQWVQEGARMWLLRGGVPALSFALLIVVMAWGRGPLAAALRWRPLVLLGEISFCMYLTHRVVLHVYFEHFGAFQGPVPMLIYGIAVLAVSYACWSMVEVPCRKLIVSGLPGLSWPSWSTVSASACSLLVLGLIWTGIWSGPPLNRQDISQARREMGLDTTPGAPANAGAGALNERPCDIAFGDDLLLLGTKTQRSAEGLKLSMYWQALRGQKMDYNVGLRLMGDGNEPLRVERYKQAAREEVLKKGDCFKNEFFVPAAHLQGVKSITFRPYPPFGPAPNARFMEMYQAPPGAPQIVEGRAAISIEQPVVAGKETVPSL